MENIKLWLVVLSVLVSNSWAQGPQTVELNESNLLQFAQTSPQLDQLQAILLRSDLTSKELEEKFAPELFGQASYLKTKERAIISFQPIWSPVKQAQVGVRQNLNHGLSAEASAVTDQRSASSPFAGQYDNVTTTTLNFTMQMDLWKDLFGRSSKAMLNNASLEARRADLERKIQDKAFRLSLRRLYWSLVANQESINISQQLLKTSEIQATEAQRRYRNSIAEADEVARYDSQVSSRQSSIIALNFQKQSLLKQLKELLPDLTNKEITLAKYDLPSVITEVIACTADIGTKTSTPYDYTQYDEMVALMKEVKGNNDLINSRYSDVDVKLFGTVKTTGVDSNNSRAGYYEGSYSGSVDDFTNNNRAGYQVGLAVAVPLGSSKKDTKTTRELYDEKRMDSAINSTNLKVDASHQQLARSIVLLNDLIKTQKQNSAHLEKRLSLMRRKYAQARISVNDLVNDQDAYFNSELATISTQLQILNTLFDYLVVFTETPCTFNRMN